MDLRGTNIWECARRPWLGRGLLWGGTVVLLLLAVLFLRYRAQPRSIASIMGLEPEETALCSVLPDRGSGASTDFTGEELKELLRMAETEQVKYLGTDLSINSSLEIRGWRVYFYWEGGSAGAQIYDNGYFDYGGRRYVLVGAPSDSELVEFLRETVPPFV